MVELLSDRFVSSEEHQLERLHSSAAIKVLDQWHGTPEEMGATLETATASIDTWLTGAQRKAAVMTKAAARARLVALERGAELIKLELQLRTY